MQFKYQSAVMVGRLSLWTVGTIISGWMSDFGSAEKAELAKGTVAFFFFGY